MGVNLVQAIRQLGQAHALEHGVGELEVRVPQATYLALVAALGPQPQFTEFVIYGPGGRIAVRPVAEEE